MYATASTEPLDIIRANECEASPGLATSRFQALWNEIERLQAALVDAGRYVAVCPVPHGLATEARAELNDVRHRIAMAASKALTHEKDQE